MSVLPHCPLKTWRTSSPLSQPTPRHGGPMHQDRCAVRRTNLSSKPDRGPRPRSVCPGATTNGARPALATYSHERLLDPVRHVVMLRQQRSRRGFEPFRAGQIFHCFVHTRPRSTHLTGSAEPHAVCFLPVLLIFNCAPHHGRSLHPRFPFHSGTTQPDVCTHPRSPATRSHGLAVGDACGMYAGISQLKLAALSSHSHHHVPIISDERTPIRASREGPLAKAIGRLLASHHEAKVPNAAKGPAETASLLYHPPGQVPKMPRFQALRGGPLTRSAERVASHVYKAAPNVSRHALEADPRGTSRVTSDEFCPSFWAAGICFPCMPSCSSSDHAHDPTSTPSHEDTVRHHWACSRHVVGSPFRRGRLTEHSSWSQPRPEPGPCGRPSCRVHLLPQFTCY